MAGLPLFPGIAVAWMGKECDVRNFQANYYAVAATGTGPNNAESSLESQVAKIVPK